MFAGIRQVCRSVIKETAPKKILFIQIDCRKAARPTIEKGRSCSFSIPESSFTECRNGIGSGGKTLLSGPNDIRKHHFSG